VPTINSIAPEGAPRLEGMLAAEVLEFPIDIHKQLVWTLRSAARRERNLDPSTRRLLDPTRALWRDFAGRLHEGDLAALVIENAASLNPLALRPLLKAPSREEGADLLTQALQEEPSLLRCPSAAFLEAAAVAFGREPLDPRRRSTFEPVRSQDQRILELPSTAGRVTSATAAPGAPIETYVAYVVADSDDVFLIGLTMLEFDRNAAPLVISAEELRAGAVRGIGTFSRAVTLGHEEEILAKLPAGAVAKVVTL
jgi:hypothetical protein